MDAAGESDVREGERGEEVVHDGEEELNMGREGRGRIGRDEAGGREESVA